MKKLTLSAISLTALIAGCSATAPKCGDQETIDLVKQILERNISSELGASMASTVTYDLTAIRTTRTDDQTGSHRCAAHLDLTASTIGVTREGPITYTVELTDKPGEFYVNILP
ncbi:MAG: hypothetical protein KBT87_11140 [Gammaproteobacteria bacterium]|nr:hypothetical protein [Gammaproteobacteria bacterium]MBQ0775217.1 hypothetical protein [Gammaproteobacteria bacterium]